MKTGNARPVKHTRGGGSGPTGGGGNGPIGGGGPRLRSILRRISSYLGHLSKAFDDLASAPIGGVPGGRGTAKKKQK